MPSTRIFVGFGGELLSVVSPLGFFRVIIAGPAITEVLTSH